MKIPREIRGKMKTINLEDMTEPDIQAFADYLYKEFFRHDDDMKDIKKDLTDIKKKFGIKPRKIYVNVRIDV